MCWCCTESQWRGPTCWTKVTQSQANECFKSVSAAKTNKSLRIINEKLQVRLSIKEAKKNRRWQARIDYSWYDNKGPNAREVPLDISTSNLHELMIRYYNVQVKVTEVSAEKINISTTEQCTSQRWHSERRNRIMSSNVGKKKGTTKVAATVKNWYIQILSHWVGDPARSQ